MVIETNENSELNEIIDKINTIWEFKNFYTWNKYQTLLKTRDFKSNIFIKKDWEIYLLLERSDNVGKNIKRIYEQLVEADEIIANYSWHSESERVFAKGERVFKYNSTSDYFEQVSWDFETKRLSEKVIKILKNISGKIIEILR